ncbi:hypothetical protein BdWA1_000134 [Babesia duncani]|uniref:Uncharacterized protein n=1 Tax=Babesia duncani TaxID=323732 RepID=A0AAD9PLM5_9APIC|nr:hypothetical protein BdWA1_000134 [Babesia duncani]
MTGQHEDVYFTYMISGTNYTFRGFQIVKFNFNSEEYGFECNKEFMHKFQLQEANLYACKDGSNKLYPWLLQLYGNYIDPSSHGSPSEFEHVSTGLSDPSSSLPGLTSFNYFFKRDGKNWKSLTFANFTDEKYQKIESIGQDQSGEEEFISQLKKLGFSAASGYVYKESGYASAIEPSQLYSYLGESDKKHTYVSGSVSEEYSVSKFSSGTESHSFEITFKGEVFEVDESSRSSEKTVTYGTENGSTATRTQISEKSQPSADIVSGTETSCKATVTEQPTKSSAAVGTGGTNGESGSGEQVTQEGSTGVSSPSSSSGTSEKSISSSNLPAIVCSAVFGSGGLIGGGILIYKCIG